MEKYIGYLTEVVSARKDSRFNVEVSDFARECGAVTGGRLDSLAERFGRDSYFNLFLTEEAAEDFRRRIFDSGLSNAVYIHQEPLRTKEN